MSSVQQQEQEEERIHTPHNNKQALSGNKREGSDISLPPFRLPSIMAFARVRWQWVQLVFSLQYLPFVLCCSLLQRIISSRSKRAASSEQKVFVRTVPKRYPTVCCLFCSLSLSLSLYSGILSWQFYGLEKSKAIEIFSLGKIQST
jgi:hypothetical protein